MTDRAFALKAAGRDIISLSVGEPDFATPPHVIAATKAALDAGETKYTAVSGTAALREAAALHFARDLGIVIPPAQVMVSAGGKQAIFHALLATLDPGDEVLIPAPWWVSYPEIVRFAGGTVVPLATTPASGYRITPAQLEAAITPQTRWLLLNSPGNPTGSVYSADELTLFGAVLARASAFRPHSWKPRSRPPRAGCCSTAPATQPARSILRRSCKRSAPSFVATAKCSY